MVSYVNNSLYGFLFCYTREPINKFDKIGNYLLKPLDIIAPRREVWITTGDSEGKKSYNYKVLEDSSSFIKSLVIKIVKFCCLPFVILGMIIKAIGLLDPDAPEIYYPWEKSLCVIESFDKILESPENYTTLFASFLYAFNKSIIPPFSECACSVGGTFNRSDNDRRRNIENEIHNHMTKEFPPQLTPNIRYLSLGSGGLLQDFINIGKLIKSGYKSIECFLVDQRIDLLQVKLFWIYINNYAKMHGSTVEVNGLTHFDDLIKSFPDTRMDVISAIDFETLPESIDLILASRKILDTKGKLFVSYTRFDWIMDQSKLIDFRNVKEQGAISHIGKDILQKISTKNQDDLLNVTYIGSEYYTEGFQIVVHLIQSGFKKIHMKIVDDGVKWSEDSLKQYLSLLCSKGEEITFEVIKIPEEYFREALSGKHNKDDLVFHFNFYAASPQDFSDNVSKYLKQNACPNYYMKFCGAIWGYNDRKPEIFYTPDEESRKQLVGLL